MGTSKGYLPPTGHLWSDAKRAISSMKRNGYSSNSIGKAMSNFSKASGSNGARKESNSVIGSSGSKVVSFSNLVLSFGLNSALDQVGLSHLKGQGTQAVFEGLIDYFSEGTNSLQQSVANQAMQEYLEEMMEGVKNEGELEEAFANMETDIFIRDYLTKYVEVSFFTNFAEKINSMCKDIGETIKLQGRIKDFIRLTISGNYQLEKLGEMDWKGSDGRQYIERKCNDIWGIFESWGDAE